MAKTRKKRSSTSWKCPEMPTWVMDPVLESIIRPNSFNLEGLVRRIVSTRSKILKKGYSLNDLIKNPPNNRTPLGLEVMHLICDKWREISSLSEEHRQVFAGGLVVVDPLEAHVYKYGGTVVPCLFLGEDTSHLDWRRPESLRTLDHIWLDVA